MCGYYFLTNQGYDPFKVLVVCLSSQILPWGLFHSGDYVDDQLRCWVADTGLLSLFSSDFWFVSQCKWFLGGPHGIPQGQIF